jgi:hypothetical protein
MMRLLVRVRAPAVLPIRAPARDLRPHPRIAPAPAPPVAAILTFRERRLPRLRLFEVFVFFLVSVVVAALATGTAVSVKALYILGD